METSKEKQYITVLIEKSGEEEMNLTYYYDLLSKYVVYMKHKKVLKRESSAISILQLTNYYKHPDYYRDEVIHLERDYSERLGPLRIFVLNPDSVEKEKLRDYQIPLEHTIQRWLLFIEVTPLTLNSTLEELLYQEGELPRKPTTDEFWKNIEQLKFD